MRLSSWALDLGRPTALGFKPRSDTFGPVAVSEKKASPHSQQLRTAYHYDRKRERAIQPRDGGFRKSGDRSGHCPDTFPGVS